MNIIKNIINITYVKLITAIKIETELSKYSSKSYIKENILNTLFIKTL
jgi:hypothetical protein